MTDLVLFFGVMSLGFACLGVAIVAIMFFCLDLGVRIAWNAMDWIIGIKRPSERSCEPALRLV